MENGHSLHTNYEYMNMALHKQAGTSSLIDIFRFIPILHNKMVDTSQDECNTVLSTN